MVGEEYARAEETGSQIRDRRGARATASGGGGGSSNVRIRACRLRRFGGTHRHPDYFARRQSRQPVLRDDALAQRALPTAWRALRQ
eukprot:SAG11_NODE_73_length_18072_cov_8.670005_8_plen_86_part_00